MEPEVLLGVVASYLMVYGFLYTPNTEFICIFLLNVVHLTAILALVTDAAPPPGDVTLVPETALTDPVTLPLRVICILAVTLQLVATIITSIIYAQMYGDQKIRGNEGKGPPLVDVETDQNKADKRNLFQLMIGVSVLLFGWIAYMNYYRKALPSNFMALLTLFSLGGASLCVYMANDLGVRLSNVHTDLVYRYTQTWA
jgi:hypothetical protein